ncbi:MAG: Asp-tRNA(Asn)/Glu-tRNA(Gln) amidotransferase subunit GatC [Planctomycetota bacterium]
MSDFSIADLARLSRIRLTPEQMQSFSSDLDRILGMVEAVRGATQTDRRPPESMNSADTVSRQDQPGPCLDRADVLSQSPLSNAGYIKVPKVFE